METQTDLLVGARVSTHRKKDVTPGMKNAEAKITAFKWMPAAEGYQPQLVAVVMFDDGAVDWRFLQYVKVLYPEGV